MGITFAVWNVKRFNYLPQRVRAVGQLIKNHDPDVFGILEFLAKDAARKLVRSDDFQSYDFAFTDSEQGVEILVGWKRKKFEQVLYTQRRDMQIGNLNLRPGGLISVLEKNSQVFTNLLFLHTDSGTDAGAYENRQAMFGKVWRIKHSLENLPEQDGQARFIALGDLNTMGKSYGSSSREEIDELVTKATQNGMRVLGKTHNKTWSNGTGTKTSNLDHVIASDDIRFKTQQTIPNLAEVLVDGWVNRTGEERKNFIKNISDHALLFVETL